MPTDFEKTLHLLQDHLSDNQICQVLSRSNHTGANKIMLDCALEAATVKGNVPELCSCLRQLMPLSTNPQLFSDAVDKLSGKITISHLTLCVHDIYSRCNSK